jgi:hypothetical protein
MYKRGYSYAQIARAVKDELGIRLPSKATIHSDVMHLLAEWKEVRAANIDRALYMEIEKCNDIIRECWEQWEKSKRDTVLKHRNREGAPSAGRGRDSEEKIQTIKVGEKEIEVIGLGEVKYLTEIGRQMQEQRKLLGLYAPEKAELSGGLSFMEALIENSSKSNDDRETKTGV